MLRPLQKGAKTAQDARSKANVGRSQLTRKTLPMAVAMPGITTPKAQANTTKSNTSVIQVILPIF